MFVVLKHTTDDGVHWDFLIEVPGRERLPTWRLHQNPLTFGDDILAESIADHRGLYLDYEGEISGGRGRVRRLDRGPATVESLDPPWLRAQLRGDHLRGTYEIVVLADGRARFRKVQEPGPSPGNDVGE